MILDRQSIFVWGACMFFEFQIFFEAEQKHHLYDKRKDRPKIKETLSLARLFGLDRAQRHPAIPFVYFATILPPLSGAKNLSFREAFVYLRLLSCNFFSPTFFCMSRGTAAFTPAIGGALALPGVG